MSRIWQAGDGPGDGTFTIGVDHLVLAYPHAINLDRLQQQAKTRPAVAGLYWHYLEPDSPERWIPVIRDQSYSPPRDLLLASGPQTAGRLVVTSLSLDRQGHINLLENVVTYVVEGVQSLAVLRRAEHISYEFRYLLDYLDINHIAYKEYKVEDLAKANIAQNVHGVAIIDPV